MISEATAKFFSKDYTKDELFHLLVQANYRIDELKIKAAPYEAKILELQAKLNAQDNLMKFYERLVLRKVDKHRGKISDKDRDDLSIRAKNGLANYGLVKFGKEKCDDIFNPVVLAQIGQAELLRIPNFGRKSLNEVKEYLAKCGLTLEP